MQPSILLESSVLLLETWEMVGSENERTKKNKKIYHETSFRRVFQMWGPKQEKVRKPWVLRLYCWIFSMRVSEKKSVVYETECRHVAIQRGKQDQNRL